VRPGYKTDARRDGRRTGLVYKLQIMNNILETKQRVISAYEVVLRPNSSIKERKDAESVK
jgi:hypothetical protein